MEDQLASHVPPPGKKTPIATSLVAIVLASLGLAIIKIGAVMKAGPIVEVPGGVVVLVSVVFALAAIGLYVLGPLDAAARYRRCPTQFTMADFLALMFLFQLPVALIRLVLPDRASPIGLLYGFAWIASCLMWGVSVQTLSRAGITTPWRRVVFLSAVLPIVYFGSVVFVSAVLLGASAALFDGAAHSMNGLKWWLATGATLPGAFYWSAQFVRATVASSIRHDEATESVG